VSTGAGTFTQYLDPLPTSSVNGSPTVLSGDFNGDLKVDLFVHYGSSGNNRLYHSNGNGTFTQYLNPITPGSINGSPSSVLVGDFNADGKRDLFIHYASSGNNRLYHSNGNGTFAQFFNPIGPSAVNGNPTGVRVGDVNGDGKADVYFHWGAAGTNRLYQSNGNATFTQFLDPINAQGINGNPTSFLIGDFNGDGKADALFYWKTTGVNRFYLSTGPGTFMQFLSPINENAINGSPDKVRVGDFNGDGIGDLYFIWGPVGTNRLFVLE
jgi:hypothetical protein